MNALTTFNQRRLLEHQVETSFLLTPFKKKHDPDADKRKAKEQARRAAADRKKKKAIFSSDESSEEDFFFLEKQLKETNELDEVDQRLLMGIVQAPPKDKKRWDKEDPDDIRRRRKEKALARGEHWSDSYDDETDGEDDGVEHLYGARNGSGTEVTSSDLLGKSGKSMMHQVQNARNKALGKNIRQAEQGVELPCPEGFDPVKWANMSLKEKLKALGISEQEWNKMTREQ